MAVLVCQSLASPAVVTDYSGQRGKTRTVIDVVARRVLRTIDLGDYRRPHGIVLLPGDSLVAVTAEQSGNVLLVHVGEGSVVAYLGGGRDARWHRVHDTGRAVGVR
ncbi:MAG: hypothetical protein ABIZ91_07735 [Gemmatimonadaceae bacterium]